MTERLRFRYETLAGDFVWVEPGRLPPGCGALRPRLLECRCYWRARGPDKAGRERVVCPACMEAQGRIPSFSPLTRIDVPWVLIDLGGPGLLPTAIHAKWEQAVTSPGEPVDFGGLVVCDLCGERLDATGRSGGFAVADAAVCPDCASGRELWTDAGGRCVPPVELLRFVADSRWQIPHGRCPAGVPFGEFVQAYRERTKQRVLVVDRVVGAGEDQFTRGWKRGATT